MIKIFFALIRSTKIISILLRSISKFLYYIWKWILIIAKKPAAFFIVCMWPILDLLLQVLTGYSFLLSPFINNALRWLLDLIIGSITGEYSINDALSQLPPGGISLMQYLGVMAAIQNYVNGLIHIGLMYIVTMSTIYISKLSLRIATRGRV